MACVTPATANATKMWYVVQTTCGELQASPAWKQLVFTGGIPTLARDTLQSAELDGSPEITGLRLGTKNVSAELAVELKHLVHDDLLSAAMQSDWVAGGTLNGESAVIDATAKTLTVTGSDVTSFIAVNDLITLPSLTGYNAGAHLVTGITFGTDTVINLAAATVEDLLIGRDGLADEIGTTDINVNNTLSVGNTRKFIALLTQFDDIDGAPKYDLTIDCNITAFGFSLGVNALTSGTFSVIGRTYQNDATLPVGSTFTDATNVASYSGIDGSITQDGLKLALSTNADITFDRNATGMAEIGSDFISHVSYGKVTNSVSLSTFFHDYSLEDFLVNGVDADYTIMARLNGNGMGYNYQTAKITEAPKDVSEGDITINATLFPYKGAGNTSSLIIRSVSA